MNQHISSEYLNKTTINKLKSYVGIDISKIGFAEVLYIVLAGITLNNLFMLLHMYEVLPIWLMLIGVVVIILSIILLLKYKKFFRLNVLGTQLERKEFVKYGSIVSILSMIDGIYTHYAVWDVLKLLFHP